MKAENRWASVTFGVLTCPALAAKQLCLRLLGQSWRVVSEWQRPGHGAWGRWQRALSFLGPGGQVLCPVIGHSSLGLVGKYWSRAWATWKWLWFCGDRAPTLDVTWLVSLSSWTQVSSILVGPQGNSLPPAEWCLCSALGDLPLMVACWVDLAIFVGVCF